MTKITRIVLIASLLVLVAGIQSAHAIAMLRLFDGTTEIIIVDGDDDDANTATGAISYTDLNIFDFTYLNISTGVVLGSSTQPAMHLHVDYTTTTSGDGPQLGGSTVVSFTETGFGPLGAPLFGTMAGGTTEGTVAFNSYIDNSNAEFGTGTEIGSLGPYNMASYDDSVINEVFADNPFSMTVVAAVNHTGDGQTGFDLDVATVVPEPVSSVLFLTGGAAFGLRRFRQKRA